ncbi:MAG: trigger factor family protein, partial [Clostridia bacterium]|nr:trigger factor family protein [Clostridia bacterium]
MSLVSANKTETNTYTVEISVSAEDFKKAVQDSYFKNRKNIQVPGFRKGKAPKHLIESLYGEDFFYEDALEAVFPAEVDAAYKEAGIEPVDQ